MPHPCALSQVLVELDVLFSKCGEENGVVKDGIEGFFFLFFFPLCF
jgi:hypothetical protein